MFMDWFVISLPKSFGSKRPPLDWNAWVKLFGSTFRDNDGDRILLH